MLLILIASTFTTDNVLTRFQPPEGFTQVKTVPGSFGAWLQQLPLKPAGTHTLTYKGKVAATDVYTAAVVDISVGHEDLQQCADAIMRLRGEYLYQQNRYKDIVFHFNSGFTCDYLHYANGYRYKNNRWTLSAKPNYTYPAFMQYMRLVFMYAGTLSLEKQLKPVSDINTLNAGDIFIHGGSPGHAMIILNVMENAPHHRLFLLAQSFMPAQNLQVLQYNGSPWFSLEKHSDILYGEMISKFFLKRF
jgi:hypothetical protein